MATGVGHSGGHEQPTILQEGTPSWAPRTSTENDFRATPSAPAERPPQRLVAEQPADRLDQGRRVIAWYDDAGAVADRLNHAGGSVATTGSSHVIASTSATENP
jgi:hypothetical protein